MKIIEEIAKGIGIVVIWLGVVAICAYVFPDKGWTQDKYKKGEVCSFNKDWYEWPDENKIKCFKYK